MEVGHMKKISQSENNIKNIVQEMMRECTNRNIIIGEDFVQYYVRLLTLDPTWNVHKEKFLDRNDVIKFVQHCLHIFQDQIQPSIIILKMQLYFKQHMEHTEDMINKSKQEMYNAIIPLEKEICEFQINPDDELEQEILVNKLYKKMIFYVTLRSSMGDPTLPPVYKEVSAAFKSIFTVEKLIKFSLEEYETKENQLSQLSDLVAGIRLFNHDCGKGGQGIEDLRKLLDMGVEAFRDDIQKRLLIIKDRVNTMTTALEQCYQLNEDKEDDTISLEYNIPPPLELSDINRIRDLLLLNRQYESFVRKISDQIDNIELKGQTIKENLQQAFVKLHEVADDKIAIPTMQIFPLFNETSDVWNELQNQIILLANLSRVLENLHSFTKLILVNNKHLKKILGNQEILTDEERLDKTMGYKIPFRLTNSEISIIDPVKFKEFQEAPLQFLGFCPWKLVETGGSLEPGNRKMNLIRVKDMFFAFSSIQAASAFSKTPIRFILRALDLARKRPELINFLGLEEQLMEVRQVDVLVPPIPIVKITFSRETQTEDHLITSKIDRNYMWNIWDWKRQAIMLANISQCQTRGPQTYVSRARCPIKSQTHGTKDVQCQTKKNNYSNVPTLSNFIFGLRGRYDDNQHIVELTRPVDE